ncbi:MAG: hypothetical protein Q9227_000296 [Pyrenula ochraceoflavens]
MFFNLLPKALVFGIVKNEDPGPSPRWFYQRSSRWFCILTASFAIFTDLFLYSITVPVIPFALNNRIGVAAQDVQHWVSISLTVYGVSLFVGSLVAGYWADKTTTRSQSFLFGLILLAGSTLMFFVAQSLEVLLAARILQGLSTSIAWTLVITIVADRVGSRGLGYAMGWVTLGRTISLMIGPLLGGILYSESGYYSVFAVATGVIVVDICLRFALIEPRIARLWDTSIGPEPEIWPDTDHDDTLETQPTSIKQENLGIIDEIGQDMGGEQGTSPPACKTKLIDRLPPIITLLRNPRMAVAAWSYVFQAILFTGCDAVIPIFCRNTFGWSSFGAGLIFLALIIPTFISPIIGWLSDKHGPKWISAGGYLLSAVPLVLLRLVTHDSMDQKVVFSALLALLGATMVFYEIPLWVEIVKVLDVEMDEHPTHYGTGGAVGQAYGLGNTAFALGSILGPIWAGFLYQSASWGTMSLSLGLLSAASAVPTIIWTGGYILEEKKPPRRDSIAASVAASIAINAGKSRGEAAKAPTSRMEKQNGGKAQEQV